MADNEDETRFNSTYNTQFPRQTPGLLGKILSLALAAVLLVLALTFSLVLFAVLAVGGLLVWVYLWWKTRELRRQMREHPQQTYDTQENGRVIEGEVIRDSDDPERPLR